MKSSLIYVQDQNSVLMWSKSIAGAPQGQCYRSTIFGLDGRLSLMSYAYIKLGSKEVSKDELCNL